MESSKPTNPPRPAKRKTESLPAVIHARSIKITVVVDQERFPFKAVPAVGTPGAKTAQLPFVVRGESGHTLHVTLKGGTLQRFAQTFRDNKIPKGARRCSPASSPRTARPLSRPASRFSRRSRHRHHPMYPERAEARLASLRAPAFLVAA